MSDFRFNQSTRRILRVVVEAMMPRWPEFIPAIEEAIIARIENLLSNASITVRFGVPLGLHGLQWLGPLLAGSRCQRLTGVPLHERTRLLERLGGSSTPLLRRWIQIYRALIAISAYTDPVVEQHLGVDRREWRRSRQSLRQQLVRADASRPAPPVPQALGSEGVVAAKDYLSSHLPPAEASETTA
jgi:hypothetical protein